MLKSSVALASLSLAFLLAPIGTTGSINSFFSPYGFSSPNAPLGYPGALAAQPGTEEDDDCDDDEGPDDGKDDGTDDGKDDGTDDGKDDGTGDGADDDCDDDGPDDGQ